MEKKIKGDGLSFPVVREMRPLLQGYDWSSASG